MKVSILIWILNNNRCSIQHTYAWWKHGDLWTVILSSIWTSCEHITIVRFIFNGLQHTLISVEIILWMSYLEREVLMMLTAMVILLYRKLFLTWNWIFLLFMWNRTRLLSTALWRGAPVHESCAGNRPSTAWLKETADAFRRRLLDSVVDTFVFSLELNSRPKIWYNSSYFWTYFELH